MGEPAVVSIDMGYGHLRAAKPLAEAFGVAMMHADRPPLADERDVEYWARVRQFYEAVSRMSQLGRIGAPLRALLNDLTDIPHLYPLRDLSRPHAGVRALDAMINRGAGEKLVQWLKDEKRPLLTTFYAPAIMADRLGYRDVWCVVTDSDINRIWAPYDGRQSNIQYLAPSPRAVHRLRAYGVRPENIHFTGFPLPQALVDSSKHSLKKRLVRLDPNGVFRRFHGEQIDAFLGDLDDEVEGHPPRIAFAIGGAGAQTELARIILEALREPLRAGQLSLTLVAGVRREVASLFESWIDELGVADGVDVLLEDDFDAYYRSFNAMLADADVLWTKPSEMSFYAALGLPLVFSRPVGVHERYNRRWVIEQGGGLKGRVPAQAAGWITEWLSEGTLAAAAWSGFVRLPMQGTSKIVETMVTASGGPTTS